MIQVSSAIFACSVCAGWTEHNLDHIWTIVDVLTTGLSQNPFTDVLLGLFVGCT